MAVTNLRSEYSAGRRAPLLVAPTGAGKTIILSAVAYGSQARGKRTLIVAHRRELIRQASAKLTETGVPHGIIAPGFTPSREMTQVGSIQTVGKRLDKMPPFDLIVVDEAHHSIAGQYKQLIDSQPQAKLLGVTATPERLDGKGLGVSCGGCFDSLVMGPAIGDLIEQEFLVPSRVFAPAEAPDLSSIRTKMGDYDTAGLLSAVDTPTLTGDALAHYTRHASGLPAIAFCITVQHARNVAAMFREAGWRAVCAHGGMPPAARDAAIRGLATGAVQVLTTCDLISEGLDVPSVGAVILLRPTKSLGLYTQQVGRGLRPAAGKKHLIVLDHAGNTLLHGLPDTPRQWSLDGRAKKQPPASVRQCTKCFAMYPPQPVCPECGHCEVSASDDGPGAARELQQIDGDLAEVDQDRISYVRAAPLRDLLHRAKTEADLREIARIRGYKPGWIFHIMQQRRGAKAAA